MHLTLNDEDSTRGQASLVACFFTPKCAVSIIFSMCWPLLVVNALPL